MSKDSLGVKVGSTPAELDNKSMLVRRLRASGIPDEELIDNLGLFLTRQNLSRINFIQDLYRLIVLVHGVIMEFGVRWGQNLSLFSNLRGIHEPFNYNRLVVGFDTFEGFPSISDQDGCGVSSGDYSVVAGYEDELDSILRIHQSNSPIPHKNKYKK